MNQSLPQEAHQLGAHQATYHPTVATGRILLGVACVTLLISLLSLSSAVSRYIGDSDALSSRSGRDRIMIGAALGLFTLLLTALLGALYYDHKTRRVDVYADGFVYTGWRKSLTFCWDDVSQVYTSPVYTGNMTRGYRSSRVANWIYTVHRNDGAKAKVGGLEGMRELGQIIQTEVTNRLLPPAIEAYRAGDEVAFGPRLGLSQQGVRVGEKLLPWADVAEVQLGQDNRVTILQQGKRLPWKSIGSHRVGNPWVLKALLNRYQ